MEPENIEPRVAALENQVRELDGRVRASEQDAVAARVLAGAADRDVTEIQGELRDFRRATVASFNALREDVTDLRTDMNERFSRVDQEFVRLGDGQQHIVELIEGLIGDQGNNGPAGP
jgi:predicted  nucleic acid-binding Zn-ribbon protein